MILKAVEMPLATIEGVTPTVGLPLNKSRLFVVVVWFNIVVEVEYERF